MDPYIGQEILGQFRLIEKIGQGGMGSVYKAEQPSMDRLVAVKILHPRLASRPDLVTRFKREAKAMSRLTHPNSVKVFLYGELERGGALYIVMEYLDGADLMRVLRRDGPMETARAAGVLVQVCGALEDAHNSAIIHRDLKPENVVLTTQGGIPDFPKVLDYGLAKIRDMGSHKIVGPILTQQGMVFGTPEFMSPEQAQGLDLDRRTDIYSLGIIFYEMISGRLPFKAQTPIDYIGHHIKTKPIPLAERAPERKFPAEVWPVLAKSIEKDPARRYQTAAEFARALATLADGASRLSGVAAVSTPAPAPTPPTVRIVPETVREPAPGVAAGGSAAASAVHVRSGPAAAGPAAESATGGRQAPGPIETPAKASPGKGLVITLLVVIVILVAVLVTLLVTRSPGMPARGGDPPAPALPADP